MRQPDAGPGIWQGLGILQHPSSSVHSLTLEKVEEGLGEGDGACFFLLRL